LEIINSADLFLSSDPDLSGFQGVKIIAQNLVIEQNTSINADNNGYDDVVDEPRNYSDPKTLGSAGKDIYLPPGSSCAGISQSGDGGGAVILEISDTLEILGIISANGERGRYLKEKVLCPATNGGDGGSIYIMADIIKGSGKIETNGGDVDRTGNPGAGGQIALYYNQNQFMGEITAFSGINNDTVYRTGNTGTVYFSNSQDKLVIKNQFSNGSFELKQSLIGLDELEFSTTSINDFSTTTLIEASNLLINNSQFLNKPKKILNFMIANDFNVLNSQDEGPGCGLADHSGASYGGIGGKNSTSSVYGSTIKPTDFGSGAKSISSSGRPGGAGAGKIFIQIANNFQLDGEIRANGEDGKLKTGGGPAMGGGSGGSVYIIAGEIVGKGAIQANGGNAHSPAGAGGGGRIAVYADMTGFSKTSIKVNGGFSDYAGGDGTVFLK